MKSSKRPNKTLFWMYMRDVFNESSYYETGLDVACGFMNTRPFFKTKRYIGLDLDEDRIKTGLKKYPKVTGKVKSIENMSSEDKGDFVTCLQTIGINSYFNSDNTMHCINKLIDSTNKNGLLVFNIGPPIKKYFYEIEKLCTMKFDKVHVKTYGRFDEQRNIYVSIFIARLMKLIPFLKESKKTPYCLMVCKHKK